VSRFLVSAIRKQKLKATPAPAPLSPLSADQNKKPDMKDLELLTNPELLFAALKILIISLAPLLDF
jgi:hypothetical protein